MLENLKKKDPPILTNDEIVAATEEVERLTNFFNEDMTIAKVTKIYLKYSVYNFFYLHPSMYNKSFVLKMLICTNVYY